MKPVTILLALALVLGACSGKSSSASGANAAGKTASPTATALPPDHPPIGETSTGGPGMGIRTGKITGTVAETMDAAGYTYLRLNTAAGEQWAAVPQTKVAVGAPVVINAQMVMDGFESKTLKRKFDHIIFGNIEGQATAAGIGTASPAPMSAPMMAGKPAAETAAATADVKVPKAEGANARTVAELWKQRTSLSGKPVVIRGKVVKFLPEIMGKNWIHLRDGSGSAAGKDNDITVTTHDKVSVGDTVIIQGTVKVDQDFGAGYTYPVIVEDAKVSK